MKGMPPRGVGGRFEVKTVFPDCLVDSCTTQACRRGWCQRHYSRWRSTGDPLGLRQASPTPGKTPQERKRWIDAHKLERGCTDCGYNAHPAALDFDHLPGTVKVRDIKSGQQLGWAALMAEVSKCEVVCANCHRIRTATRRQQGTLAS